MSEKQEVGYYNPSTKQVIPGYNPIFHSLSKTKQECDKNGHVSHVEQVNGVPREIRINLGGQFKLDRQQRGGDRLWQRIYSQEDLKRKLQNLGVSVGDDSKEEDPGF